MTRSSHGGRSARGRPRPGTAGVPRYGRLSWPAGRTGRAPADPDSVLAVIEQAVDAFAGGYGRARRLVARKEEAARREFIDDLLHGRGDQGRLAARSERFGLHLSRAHAVAVAEEPEKYDETDPVPLQMAGDLFAASRTAASCTPPRTAGWCAPRRGPVPGAVTAGAHPGRTAGPRTPRGGRAAPGSPGDSPPYGRQAPSPAARRSQARVRSSGSRRTSSAVAARASTTAGRT
ncbi:hypothetical protein [Streptomyces scabiei]|uniref:hypothetical protein n=1 Tax=Streptomyces scabiei TaxID=1930 RepID=UPI0039F719FE